MTFEFFPSGSNAEEGHDLQRLERENVNRKKNA